MDTGSTFTRTAVPATHVFERVLVGIDGSDASLEAARQAAILTEHYGGLTLLGVYPPPRRPGLDPAGTSDSGGARAASENAVAAVRDAIRSLVVPTATVACGYSWETLLEEAESSGSTLLSVGSHGQRRIQGIIEGSTTTELVHKAPCSVLVARLAAGGSPQRIVVGLDGSAESERAYAAAHRVAGRFGSALRAVVAAGRKQVDLPAIVRLTDNRYEKLSGEPVGALVEASADADLLVVGSRGLHGLKAFGSVSERVAHRARCSTLVVREPASEQTPAG